jgi:hypothetical protein
LHGQRARDRLPYQLEHFARPGVEEQWLIINNKKLIKCESAGPTLYNNRRIDVENPIRNFIKILPRLLVREVYFYSPCKWQIVKGCLISL